MLIRRQGFVEQQQMRRYAAPYPSFQIQVLEQATYLDQPRDKIDNVWELAQVDIEVIELVVLGFFEHDFGSLADGAQAA